MSARPACKALLPYTPLILMAAALCAFHWNDGKCFDLLLRVLLLCFGYAASVQDLREKRVPNQLVLAMLGAYVLAVVPWLFYDTETALAALISGAVGTAAAGAVFLLVYFVSRRGLGGGDVKFMAAAGLYLGAAPVLSVMLTGSVLAALTGLGGILLKKLTPKDTLPLVPFLYAGILVMIFFG